MKNRIKTIISIISFVFFLVIGIFMIILKSDNVISLYANSINVFVNKTNDINDTFDTFNEDGLVVPIIENDKNDSINTINANLTSYSKDLFQHFLTPLKLNTDIQVPYEYKSLKNNNETENIDNQVDDKNIENFGPDTVNINQTLNTQNIIDNSKWTRVENSFQNAPDGYFDDALFLGDSRTEGLRIYAPIENTTYFSVQSLSVFNLNTTEVHINGEGNYKFYDFLKTRKFKKVYIMLGINSAGGKIWDHLLNYASVIYKIREENPDCLIYLLANIHVGKEKNKSEFPFNNNKLNELNDAISSIADNISIFYIDANVLFDDENGELNKNYTGDSIHIYPKYYSWFRELLYRNVIVK